MMQQPNPQTQDDTWEVPKQKNWRLKRRTPQSPPSSSQSQNGLPKGVAQGLTIAKLTAELSKMQRTFAGSECAKSVARVLKRTNWEGEVEKAVCIGIGSLSRDWENRWRAMWQLVLFLYVVGEVSSTEQSVQLFAQDPAFLGLDITFLSTLKPPITVLTSDIEQHISPSTFVFAPFVDWNLLLPTFLKDREPELYVGNEILEDYTRFANSEEKKRVVEECNGIGRKWREGREWVWVPEFEGGGGLEGLGIAWRMEVDDEGR